MSVLQKAKEFVKNMPLARPLVAPIQKWHASQVKRRKNKPSHFQKAAKFGKIWDSKDMSLKVRQLINP